MRSADINKIGTAGGIKYLVKRERQGRTRRDLLGKSGIQELKVELYV